MVEAFAYLTLMILIYFAIFTIAKTTGDRKRRSHEKNMGDNVSNDFKHRR